MRCRILNAAFCWFFVFSRLSIQTSWFFKIFNFCIIIRSRVICSGFYRRTYRRRNFSTMKKFYPFVVCLVKRSVRKCYSDSTSTCFVSLVSLRFMGKASLSWPKSWAMSSSLSDKEAYPWLDDPLFDTDLMDRLPSELLAYELLNEDCNVFRSRLCSRFPWGWHLHSSYSEFIELGTLLKQLSACLTMFSLRPWPWFWFDWTAKLLSLLSLHSSRF